MIEIVFEKSDRNKKAKKLSHKKLKRNRCHKVASKVDGKLEVMKAYAFIFFFVFYIKDKKKY